MKTYILDINEDITLDYVNSVLPTDFMVDEEDNTIKYRGTDTDVDFLRSNNIHNILEDNNISFSTGVYCNECGDLTEDYTEVYDNYGNNYYVCEYCINNNDKFFYCDDCEVWYDNSVDRYYTADNRVICDGCYGDDYTSCDECGDIIRSDDAYYCERHDAYYCEYCYDNYHSECEEQGLLYDYHTFHDWQPKAVENETPKFYIGYELEIDEGSDTQRAVDIIQDIDNIPMHDGSLSYRGIEQISHPLTYKYHLSIEDKTRQAFDELINLGYKSHNTNTCGLHFHVTRPEDSKIIDRILLFMETYKEEIVTISRRKSREELGHWARFLSDKRQNLDTKVIKSLDYIVNNKDTCDRYMALNLTNEKTIEFRFFKGTLKYETFMADLEFINNLVEYASDLTLPIEKMTWTLVTSKGKYLPQYIEEHNLQSDKPIIDYSKELVATFNAEKDTAREELEVIIAKLLKVIANRARRKNDKYTKLRETNNILYNTYSILQTAQGILYELENIQALDYYRLDSINSDLRYLKERIGD